MRWSRNILVLKNLKVCYSFTKAYYWTLSNSVHHFPRLFSKIYYNTELQLRLYPPSAYFHFPILATRSIHFIIVNGHQRPVSLRVCEKYSHTQFHTFHRNIKNNSCVVLRELRNKVIIFSFNT